MKLLAAFILISASGLAQANPLAGDWGGQHVSLQLTAQGGTLEFDCAHGGFTGQIKPDSNGRFDISGTYTPEHGGPVRRDETSATQKVRYDGKVTGNRMTLAVRRADSKAAIDDFVLEKDKEPMVVKCR